MKKTTKHDATDGYVNNEPYAYEYGGENFWGTSTGTHMSINTYGKVDDLDLSDDVIKRLSHNPYGSSFARSVVMCGHCGQWGARFCACKHCGAPIE